MILAAFDLGMNRTGYAIGDPARPDSLRVGAWRFPSVGEEFGKLGGLFWRNLINLPLTYGADPHRVIFEAPLLDRYRDRLTTLRATYGLGFMLESWADVVGVPIEETDYSAVKLALAGNRKATKDDQVAAAERAGVVLPKTKADGREDAADAFGVWLVGVALYDRKSLPEWDRRRFSPRGASLL